MNPFARLEGLIRGVFEGTSLRLFGGDLQPADIASRLAHAMDDGKVILANRSAAPNEYVVQLGPEDFAHFEPSRATIERELVDFIRDAARERNLVLLVPPSIRIEKATDLPRRAMRVSARSTDRAKSAEQSGHTSVFRAITPPPEPEHRREPARPREIFFRLTARNGTVYNLTTPVVRIGRALDNDIVIEDSRASRYHAEIRRAGDLYTLRDLRSTNGSYVNGNRTTEQPLRPDDELMIGDTILTFRQLESDRG